jgi:methylated-DNA-[protein]-cysteine S-methyltransferase
MYDVVVAFPRMKVAVRTRDERVTDIVYLPPSTQVQSARSALGERAGRQLEAYLADPDTRFDLPLQIEGTPFQRRLWAALCEIPRGKTLTYGELA